MEDAVGRGVGVWEGGIGRRGACGEGGAWRVG
jgi:hypothetical protein